MLISELILELQDCLVEHGDLPVNVMEDNEWTNIFFEDLVIVEDVDNDEVVGLIFTSEDGAMKLEANQ